MEKLFTGLIVGVMVGYWLGRIVGAIESLRRMTATELVLWGAATKMCKDLSDALDTQIVTLHDCVGRVGTLAGLTVSPEEVTRIVAVAKRL